MRRTARAIMGALVAVALVVGLIVGPAAPARADGEFVGVVQGTVSDSDGAAVAGAEVKLYTIDDMHARTLITETTAAANGVFSLAAEPLGTYYLLATDPALNNGPTWWPEPSSTYVPDSFPLTEAGVMAAITMNKGVAISGMVTFRGEAQAGVKVCLSQDTPCGESAADGSYVMRGITPSFYKLVAVPPRDDLAYVRTWYPNYRDSLSIYSGPEPINSDTASHSWDFQLAARPQVTGSVADGAGAGVSGATVCIADSTNCALAGSGGNFTLEAEIPRTDYLRLTASASGYNPASVRTSTASGVVITLTALTKPAVTGKRPSIGGKTAVGKKLRVRTGSWAPSGVELTYRWFRNGKRIPQATKATYRLTRRDWRKRITVAVTGKLDGYTSVVKKSKATKRISRH
jgi:hypothetical protein